MSSISEIFLPFLFSRNRSVESEITPVRRAPEVGPKESERS